MGALLAAPIAALLVNTYFPPLGRDLADLATGTKQADKVVVEMRAPDSGMWITPAATLADLPPPPSDEPPTGCLAVGFADWLRRSDAAPTESFSLVRVRSEADSPVTLEGIEIVRAGEPREPVRGIPVRCIAGGPGPPPDAIVTVQFDRRGNPQPPLVTGPDGKKERARLKLTVQTSGTEFLLRAMSARKLVRWYAVLTFTVEGEEFTRQLGPNRGFALTAAPSKRRACPSAVWSHDRWAWFEPPDSCPA